MALGDTNKIDIVLQETPHAKLTLLIVDGGIHADQAERNNKFTAKLDAYLGFIVSPSFKKSHPGIRPDEVLIGVLCKQPPKEKMKQMLQISPKGHPSIVVRVACAQHDIGGPMPWFIEKK